MKEKIGRYQIESRFPGGMGIVYKAFDPIEKRYVAIKTIHPRYQGNKTFYKRFILEVQTVIGIEHEAMVPIFEFNKEHNPPYLVMKWMDGGNLKERLDKEGALSFKDAFGIFVRVVGVLQEVHKRRKLHLDVKPLNILFDDQGNAFLTDFGITKRLDTGEQTSKYGTPEYMSPEQWRGERLGVATDIYTLGISLFETLTGRLPYIGQQHELRRMHLNTRPPDIVSLNPNLPSYIQKVIEVALAKDFENRYQSTHEMLDDLRYCMEEFQRDIGESATRIDSGFLECDGPVPPSEFMDRNNEIRRTRDRIKTSQSTVVSGPSCVGKTSFLLKMEELCRIQTLDKQCIWIPSLLQARTKASDYSIDHFWQEILTPLEQLNEQEIRNKLKEVSRFEYEPTNLGFLFELLEHRNYRLVLLLDDFDQFLRLKIGQDMNFLKSLRVLLSNHKGFVVIFTTTLSMIDLNEGYPFLFSSNGSALMNPMTEIVLGYLFEEE